MKFILCLTVICITLSFCSGYCFQQGLVEYMTKDGKSVMQDECVDVFDGTRHPFGSNWNSSHCMECSCDSDGMRCCTRYGGALGAPGCKAILDREACEYKLYKLDDPTKPCFP